MNKLFREARAGLKKSIDEQTAGLKQFGSQIEDLSDGTVSVTIAEQGDLSDIYAALETLAVRTRSQEAVRTRKFGEQAASDGVWKTLDKLATEVGALLLSWKIGADGDDREKGQPDIATVAAI